MKNKSFLVIMGIFISLLIANVNYGIYPILRKHKFLTKQRGNKLPKRYYTKGLWNKFTYYGGLQYLRNKWNDYFYKTKFEQVTPSPIADFVPIKRETMMKTEENIGDWLASKFKQAKENTQDLPIDIEILSVFYEKNSAEETFNKIIKQLSHNFSQIESRLKYMWGKIIKDQENGRVGFYKPMGLSEILLQRLIVDTKLGPINFTMDVRGEVRGQESRKHALQINESNNKDWRFSVLCQGDFSYSASSNELVKKEEAIRFSILFQAINILPSDQYLYMLSETVINNYLEFINQQQGGFYISDKDKVKCIKEILQYIKDVSNDQTVIAGAGGEIEEKTEMIKMIISEDVTKFNSFNNDLTNKKVDLSDKMNVSLKKGYIKEIYKIYRTRYNNYSDVLDEVKKIINKYIRQFE